MSAAARLADLVRRRGALGNSIDTLEKRIINVLGDDVPLVEPSARAWERDEWQAARRRGPWMECALDTSELHLYVRAIDDRFNAAGGNVEDGRFEIELAEQMGGWFAEFHRLPFTAPALTRAYLTSAEASLDLVVAAARNALATASSDQERGVLAEQLKVAEAQHREVAVELAERFADAGTPLFRHLYSERRRLEEAAEASYTASTGRRGNAPYASHALAYHDHDAENGPAGAVYRAWRQLQEPYDQLWMAREGSEPANEAENSALVALTAFLRRHNLHPSHRPYGRGANPAPDTAPAAPTPKAPATPVVGPTTYALDDGEIAEIAREYLVGRSRHAIPTPNPRACLLAGAPGADKVGLTAELAQELGAEGGVIRIDADRLRERLPYFSQLAADDREHAMERSQRDATRLASAVLKQAVQQKYNVLVEGTLRDPNAAVSLAKQLRNNGYRVEIHAVAAPELASRVGLALRAETEREAGLPPRTVRDDILHSIYAAVERTVERVEAEAVADRVLVHERYGAVLFDSSSSNGFASATEALKHGRAGLDADQKCTLAEDWDLVVEMMRRRQATGPELAAASAHRAEAHHQMRQDTEARASYEEHATPPQRAESRHLAEQHATYLAATHTWPRSADPIAPASTAPAASVQEHAPRRAARSR